MEMCYDGALVMPSSYAVMNEEEMTYVEGGSLTINRENIRKALACAVGAALTITGIYELAKLIAKAGVAIAKFYAAAGPLAQAAIAWTGMIIASCAITVACIYISGGSITIG